MDSIKNDGNLYKVTVKQVKDCINGYKEAIVYEYLPFALVTTVDHLPK